MSEWCPQCPKEGTGSLSKFPKQTFLKQYSKMLTVTEKTNKLDSFKIKKFC